MHSPTSALAIDGAAPTITEPLPTVATAAGRTLGDEELAGLRAVLASGMLSGVWGTQVKALQVAMAELYRVPSAVACSSGTAALHLAVAAARPEVGDEIITSPISDFGSIAPILAQNAIPVFADVDPATGCLDPASVAAAITPRTRAILAVHLFGAPARIHELRAIADANGLFLIEDCAQAWLTEVDDHGTLAGTVGDIGCLSLQQWKHITCGDGGLTVTARAELAEFMTLFADKGWPRAGGTRTHLHYGLNYRMSELQGAVALAQLAKVRDVVRRRREGANRLLDQLTDLGALRLPARAGHSWWTMPLLVDAPAQVTDRCAAALRAEGLAATRGYLERPLYANPALRDAPIYGTSRFPLEGLPGREPVTYPDGLCPVAEDMIGRTLINLQWNENYTPAQVDQMAAAIRKVHHALIA